MTLHLLLRRFKLLSSLVCLVALALFAAACSQEPPAATGSDTSEADVAVDDVVLEADKGAEGVESEDSVDVDGAPLAFADVEADLARFIASTEAVLAGSPMEGVVLDDPETYIAIGQSTCARFSQGDSVDQVVADYLEQGLEQGEDSADEQRLVGAIIGAAVETMCPEHASLI